MDAARAISAVAMIWAAASLSWQLRRLRAEPRRDHSVPRGDPRRGTRYLFGAALLPWKKESVTRHPVEFALGAALHAGTLAVLGGVLVVTLAPAAGASWLAFARPLFAVSALAGAALIVRRVGSRDMRALSVPEDYLAAAVTVGLLVAAMRSTRSAIPLLVYAAALFVYLPLGKLRHAVFYFAARADFGRRLGWRGVYPPARATGAGR